MSSGSLWSNTDVAYDIALGGLPFIYAINDARPYLRQTAPFRKDQFDNSPEPGEQSLSGWWVRSQSSFHAGTGINFYDPLTNDEFGHYRFNDSECVNVWNKGKVTMLNKTDVIGYPAAGLQSNGRSTHYSSAIKWTVSGTNYQGVLDGGDYNIVRITETGSIQPLVALTGTQDKIYAISNDGDYVYYIVNEVSGSLKMHMYKKSLSAALGTASTLMFTDVVLVANATMAYTKERLILGVNNSVYEMASTAVALPTPVYTHPNTAHLWTSVTSSGSAIYVAGWNGLLSTIVKFTLTSNGSMPVLTSAITAAELPDGERIYSIRYYLGYLLIGTNKGARISVVSDSTGSINYGPLIFETVQPVFAFAFRDHFAWCASGTTTGRQGLIRIDLGQELESLRFAYANDLQISEMVDGGQTVSVSFLGETDQLFWTSCSSIGRVQPSVTYKQLTGNVATLTTAAAHDYIVGEAVYVSGVGAPFDSTAGYGVGTHKIITDVTATTFSYAVTNTDIALTAVSPAGFAFSAGAACIESATVLEPTGYLTTGKVRYSTLEPKNFKRLLARGNFDHGTVTLETVTKDGTIYDHITYEAGVTAVEVGTTQPETPQEYISYRFSFARDADDSTLGPVFEGWQAKSTIATPRQRIIQFPVFCFDVETDRNNVLVGYEGRADTRLRALEAVEENGDVVVWQDLGTGESRQCVIEQVTYSRMTPPDKRFDGQGGIIEVRIRTV